MNEIKLSKNEIRNRLNSIRIQPKGLHPRDYGVSVKYFKGTETSPYKRIDYNLQLAIEVDYNQGILTIDKNNVFYNQHEPDLINEIIANSISQAIYPLKVELNEKGQSNYEIINYDEVLKRWQIQKEKLSEKYVSDTLTNFFSTVDSKFNNQKQIERSLANDWFWNLFFHPKLLNYGENRTINHQLYLAVIPYQSPLRFEGIQKIEKIPTNYHSFEITFESLELKAPDYFKPKNIQVDNNLYMKLDVHFDLDIYHHFAMHTRAYFEVYTKDQFENKTILKRIEFTQYQQNTEEYSTKKLSIDSPFITGGLVKLPPNKWGFDNFENLENNW